MRKNLMKKRLILSILSVVCCATIFSVGVFAASTSYTLQVVNAISINYSENFIGTLEAKRCGAAIYGSNSRNNGTTNEAVVSDFITLHGSQSPLDDVNNQLEITRQVCFNTNVGNRIYENDKSYYQIYYVFKYTYPANILEGEAKTITISISDNSTNLDSFFNDKVIKDFKVEQKNTETEPTWSGVANGTSLTSINYSNRNNLTYTYIYASLKVEATDTLAGAFHLGQRNGSKSSNSAVTYGNEYHWAFTISISQAD